MGKLAKHEQIYDYGDYVILLSFYERPYMRKYIKKELVENLQEPNHPDFKAYSISLVILPDIKYVSEYRKGKFNNGEKFWKSSTGARTIDGLKMQKFVC